jgi:type I restriction enzyme S subunit
VARDAVQPSGVQANTAYLGLEDISGDTGEATARPVDAGELKSAKFTFSPEHLLYGKLRPNLRKVTRPTVSGICSTDILPLLPSVAIERDYLFHWLRQPNVVATIASRTTGVNLPRISPQRLLELDVPVPPLAEQRRIAALLDRADAVRRKREEGRRLVDELLRSVFLEMFGDPVRNEKGWEVVGLGEVAEIQGGLQVSASRKHLPVHAPYLRVANVLCGRLDLTEVKQLGMTQGELDRTKLKTGDILMVEGHGNPEEIGRCAAWDGSIDPCSHQNHLIRVRVNPGRLTPDYLVEYLNSAGGRRQLARLGKTTSGLNTISTRQVAGLSVALPPIREQVRYSVIVSAINNLAGRIGDTGLATTTLAKAILSDTMKAAL